MGWLKLDRLAEIHSHKLVGDRVGEHAGDHGVPAGMAPLSLDVTTNCSERAR